MAETEVKITPEWVRNAVQHIRDIASDDEAAHGAEDELYRHVLEAIAGGWCEDPAECAREALETRNIEFERWCA